LATKYYGRWRPSAHQSPYGDQPLVQGWLEIACYSKDPWNCQNHLIMDRYIHLVKERYTEPENETIMGTFLNREIPEPIALARPPKSKKKRKNTGATGDSKDIRVMFYKVNKINDRNGKNKEDFRLF
jgi:uncharacterized protein with ATP-grasp and redox domains